MSSTTNGYLTEDQSWRVAAAELNAFQVHVLTKYEERGTSKKVLLGKAMAYGTSNLAQTLYFENLPLPQDSEYVSAPVQSADGTWVRHFYGHACEVTEKNQLKMRVYGLQRPDGTAEGTLGIWFDNESTPDFLASLNLDSIDARRFGEALIDAANEIDRLAQGNADASSAP